MEKNFTLLLLLLFIGVGLHAQKDQIKEAQSLYDKGNLKESLAIVKKIDYMIVNASLEEKSDFYFLKGNIYKDLASKNIDAAENFALASGAYQDVLLYENDSRKYKYAFKANIALKEMKSTLVDGAMLDYKQGKFNESAEKSYKVYLFDKKDTLNLLNAAGAALTGKDFTSAIKYYDELRKINYTGKGVLFYATNKKTREESAFISLAARESNILAGLYEKPRNESPPSKQAEVTYSLAYAYLERNDYPKAQMYYDESIRLNPKCIDCYINMAYSKLQLKKVLMDEMANLGNSAKEMQEYDVLNAKKDELVKSTIPYLKKALVIEPKNEEVTKFLLGVYRSLDMTADYNTLKASL